MAEDPAALPAAVRDWRALTPARIGLGRTGSSLPTQALLAFTLDHARARDAVHAPFAPALLADDLSQWPHETLIVASEATQRADYLRRPDLGRQLSQASRAMLSDRAPLPCDIAIIIGDGLSPAAVTENAVALVTALLPLLGDRSLGPIVIAEGARVALGDSIGALLSARLVIMIIGERPGLTTPRSLGAYLTVAPAPGRSDADRNCVSNIHAAGLPVAQAAAKIAWLARAALDRGISGVALKDDSGLMLLPNP